jgi:uncharacterized protein (TIGR00251 family)
MRLQVHVTPRSRVNAVEVSRAGSGGGSGAGSSGGASGGSGEASIRVRVTAPPEDGKANDAVVALLAKRLGVPRRAVRVVSGATSRVKWLEVEGLDEEELWRRLEPEAAS